MVMATSGHIVQQIAQKMQSSGRAWQAGKYPLVFISLADFQDVLGADGDAQAAALAAVLVDHVLVGHEFNSPRRRAPDFFVFEAGEGFRSPEPCQTASAFFQGGTSWRRIGSTGQSNAPVSTSGSSASGTVTNASGSPLAAASPVMKA